MLQQLLQYGGAFFLSLGLALYLTPVIRRGALAFGIVDRPDGRLKRQAEPVAYLGGVAVYLAFLLTVSLLFELDGQLLGVLLGATLVLMLGFFDDLHVLSPTLKLLGQLLATWVMLRSDISIQLISLPTVVAVLLTVFWLIGVTNAVNIVDVSDGLATGVSAIAALGLFAVAVLDGHPMFASVTLALVGSLVGFWRYNAAPARIYLGDTGSLFIGFMLAALALLGAYTARNEIAALAPLLILFVPILDTTLVVIARVARGRSPFKGSPDHFAIRLKRRGWSSEAVTRFACGVQVVAAGAGVALPLVSAAWAVALLLAMAALFLGLLTWLMSWNFPEQTVAEESVSRVGSRARGPHTDP